MRRTLVAAVALAPLCLVAGMASAQTATTAPVDTVTSSLSAPIATATSVSNGPGDIDITTGAVSIGSAATAATAGVPSGFTYGVLLNSDNNVNTAGSVSVNNVNNSAAILALGGTAGSGTNTQNIINTGTISNGDGFSAATNSDGLSEEPYATTGSVGRYGIRVLGSGTLEGSINNSGTITVDGDNSYGISVEAPVAGALTSSGTIAMTGDNTIGISSVQGGTIGTGANGGIVISGAISTLGQNSSAINLQGDVDGRISIYSSITSTAYASTSRPSTSSSLTSVEQTGGTTNTQVGQSAGAVIIGGNVTGGILIGAPPVGTTTATSLSVDLDADGIADVAEGSGSITNYGSAAALTVGGTGNTTIGVVGTSNGLTDMELTANGTTLISSLLGQSPDNFGIIIRGAVQGLGVYDGVAANGLFIGGQLGANGQVGTVNVTGGVRVVGSVTADSYEAAATAIQLGAGATVPLLDNEDYIEASISHSALTTTSTSTAVATGVLINSGAVLPKIANYGTIQASATGDNMSAYGVRDLSGTVANFLNEGVIATAVSPVTTCQSTCSTVAVDLSNNTSGIAFTQQANATPIAIDVTTTTSSTGVVSTTAALSTATATTTTTTTTTTAGVTTTTTTTTPTTPQIVGDVLLGSGTNTVQILGGTVTGALSLGGGANDILTINGGAVVDGPLTNVNKTTGVAGTGLTLNVASGILFNTQTGALNLSSLSVGSTGVLYAAVDPVANAETVYAASGTATFASGGQLGIVLRTPLQTAATYTVVTAAGGLNSAVPAATLLTTDVPYLITGTATETGNSISVTLTPKTAAQLGLNPAESAALAPILTNLPNDSGIQNSVLGAYTQANFLKAYQQLLPDYAGGVFQLALAASDSVTRATSRVNDIQNPSGTRGAWAEEVAFGVNKNADSQAAGYQGGGFGFVGGVETGGLGLGAFGLTGSFLTGDVKDPHAPGDNLQSFSEGEGGAYWQAQLGGFRGDARVGAGYVLDSERREFLLTDNTGAATIDRSARGNSSGYSLTGHVGLGYQTPQFGLFYFRPQVRGDYFRLQQNGYTERYGGEGFDLTVGDRTGDAGSGTASLVTGMAFGSGFQWRPELELGYRDVFTGTAGDTIANFQGGTQFVLPPAAIRGGGPVGRLDVKADTDFYELNFEAGAEQRMGLVSADARISVRVLF